MSHHVLDQARGHFLTRHELAAIGTELWGRHWQKPMAEALLSNQHTVGNWYHGRSHIPGPAVACLRLLLRDHRTMKEILG